MGRSLLLRLPLLGFVQGDARLHGIGVASACIHETNEGARHESVVAADAEPVEA